MSHETTEPMMHHTIGQGIEHETSMTADTHHELTTNSDQVHGESTATSLQEHDSVTTQMIHHGSIPSTDAPTESMEHIAPTGSMDHSTSEVGIQHQTVGTEDHTSKMPMEHHKATTHIAMQYTSQDSAQTDSINMHDLTTSTNVDVKDVVTNSIDDKITTDSPNLDHNTGMNMHHPTETTMSMEDHTDNIHMNHDVQSSIHDSATEAPMNHETPTSGMDMEHIKDTTVENMMGHHESTMAMMKHEKTTKSMDMHHDITTIDNTEEDALGELGELGDMDHPTQPMMHHEAATTIDSVQTTAIDNDAAETLGELDDMNHPDLTASSSSPHATVEPAAATDAAVVATTAEVANEDAAAALGEIDDLVGLGF